MMASAFKKPVGRDSSYTIDGGIVIPARSTSTSASCEFTQYSKPESCTAEISERSWPGLLITLVRAYRAIFIFLSYKPRSFNDEGAFRYFYTVFLPFTFNCTNFAPPERFTDAWSCRGRKTGKRKKQITFTRTKVTFYCDKTKRKYK